MSKKDKLVKSVVNLLLVIVGLVAMYVIAPYSDVLSFVIGFFPLALGGYLQVAVLSGKEKILFKEEDHDPHYIELTGVVNLP